MSTNKGPKPCPNEGENGDKRCTYKTCGNLHTNPSSKAYIPPVGGEAVQSGAEIPVCQPVKGPKPCSNEGEDGTKRCTFKNCGNLHTNPSSKAYIPPVGGGAVQSGETTKKTEPVVCKHCNQELKETWGQHKIICSKWPKLNASAKEFIPSTIVNTDEGDGEEKEELNDAFIAYSDDEEEEDDNDLSIIEKKLYGEDDEDDDFCDEFIRDLELQELVGTFYTDCKDCVSCKGYAYGKDKLKFCELCV
jgi:hypothetical protein